MRRILASLICVYLFSITVHAQSVQQKAIVLKRMMELNHYSPRPVNDSFSLSLFKAVINATDSRRLLFTDPEYKRLSVYMYGLDDELNGKGWAFVDLATSLYKNALLRADSIAQKILSKP